MRSPARWGLSSGCATPRQDASMSPTESTQQRLTSPVSTRSEALRFRLPDTAASVGFRQSGSDRRVSLQGRLQSSVFSESSHSRKKRGNGVRRYRQLDHLTAKNLRRRPHVRTVQLSLPQRTFKINRNPRRQAHIRLTVAPTAIWHRAADICGQTRSPCCPHPPLKRRA